MKRLISVFLSLLLLATFISCKSKDTDEAKSKSDETPMPTISSMEDLVSVQNSSDNNNTADEITNINIALTAEDSLKPGDSALINIFLLPEEAQAHPENHIDNLELILDNPDIGRLWEIKDVDGILQFKISELKVADTLVRVQTKDRKIVSNDLQISVINA